MVVKKPRASPANAVPASSACSRPCSAGFPLDQKGIPGLPERQGRKRYARPRPRQVLVAQEIVQGAIRREYFVPDPGADALGEPGSFGIRGGRGDGSERPIKHIG